MLVLRGMISRPILDLEFFFKANVTHKIQEDSCKKIQGQLAKDNLEIMRPEYS